MLNKPATTLGDCMITQRLTHPIATLVVLCQSQHQPLLYYSNTPWFCFGRNKIGVKSKFQRDLRILLSTQPCNNSVVSWFLLGRLGICCHLLTSEIPNCLYRRTQKKPHHVMSYDSILLRPNDAAFAVIYFHNYVLPFILEMLLRHSVCTVSSINGSRRLGTRMYTR